MRRSHCIIKNLNYVFIFFKINVNSGQDRTGQDRVPKLYHDFWRCSNRRCRGPNWNINTLSRFCWFVHCTKYAHLHISTRTFTPSESATSEFTTEFILARLISLSITNTFFLLRLFQTFFPTTSWYDFPRIKR